MDAVELYERKIGKIGGGEDDKKPGVCPKCGRWFQTKSGREGHLKEYHND